MSDVLVDDELVRARGEAAEFGPTLANHLPMLLVALERLGASRDRRRAFAAGYRVQNGLLALPAAIGLIHHGNWAADLGERNLEAEYRAFFAAELRRLSQEALVRTYLPTLAPGIAASATHALMRLAYAHLDDSADEVATALGYWAATYLPLPAGAAVADIEDPVAVLLRLQAHRHLLEIWPETDLLWHAMRAVAADAAFAVELDRLATGPASLPRFAAASLALFATTQDFCALHALTGTHWIRLLPEAADRPTLLRHFWRAIAAAYPKMGMPDPLPHAALEALRQADCPEWPEIHAAAVASDDEHDISLVFSAWQEARCYGDPLYRRVAARRMGLL